MRWSTLLVKAVFFVLVSVIVCEITPAQMVKRAALPPPVGITVTAPKAGESFRAGFPITISWTYSGNVGQTVRVLLHRNSAPGADAVLVSWTLDGSGAASCSARIPNDAAPGNDYTIVVESNQNPVMKGRSGVFTLLGAAVAAGAPIGSAGRPGMVQLPLISLNKPVAGEQWQHGTSYAIAWSNQSAEKAFRAQISLLRGSSGNVVQKVIAGSALISQGSFNWTVTPDVPPGQYRVHIRGTGPNENIFGTGEVIQVVKPGITVSFMPQRRYYLCGTKNEAIPVEWTYTGVLGDYVSITWIPAQFQKGEVTIFASGWPIGKNGKGSFVFNLYEQPAGGSICSVLREQPSDKMTKEKSLFGYIEVKVIGTSFSAKSEVLTLCLRE